jgi:DNA ligase-1
MSNYQIIKSSGLFEDTQTKKAKRLWRNYVVKVSEGVYATQSEYWSDNGETESSHIWSEPKICKPKNVGRSNETTSILQAHMEWGSDCRKKADKGYKDTSGEFELGEAYLKNYVFPTKAEKYLEHKDDVVFPVFVQPKLDGFRCMTDGTDFWTSDARSYLPEVVAHIKRILQPVLRDGMLLDGELMMPPNKGYKFEDIQSYAKKYDPQHGPNMEFHVFDCYYRDKPDYPFYARTTEVHNLMQWFTLNDPNDPRIICVQTTQAHSHEDILEKQVEFTIQGYEGTMIRKGDSPYRPKVRTTNILKLKDFMDAEFEIIDVVEGEGKETGQGIFVCKTLDGKTFPARPRGVTERRREYFQNPQNYIGKWLTVRFQNWTDDKYPRFPVGIPGEMLEGIKVREPLEGVH